jgi:hypothetical protein
MSLYEKIRKECTSKVVEDLRSFRLREILRRDAINATAGDGGPAGDIYQIADDVVEEMAKAVEEVGRRRRPACSSAARSACLNGRGDGCRGAC